MTNGKKKEAAPKVVSLGIYDRITLPQVLSIGQGSFEQFLRGEALKTRLAISEDERTKARITDLGDGRVSWADQTEREFSLSEGELEHVRLCFKVMGAKGALPFDPMFSALVRKFFDVSELQAMLAEIENKKVEA